MRRKIYTLFVAAIVLSACQVSIDEPDAGSVSLKKDIYPITVEVELPQYAAGSRSSFTDDQLDRITDLNVFIYHDGCLLEEHSGYFDDMSSLMLSFPHDKDGFNIYMVGNVGRIDAPEEESDICDIRYAVQSYDEFRTKGFPIANVFPDHVKGTLAVFRLKRLIGQYDIVMRPSASDAEYVVRDVRLMNCALDMYPFDIQRKATSFTGAAPYGDDALGDMLTDEDIVRLNDGEPVSLYLVENLQGELLPDNTDRRKKIPSCLELVGSGLADCCTYIEITADIITPAAQYTDGKYRFYLGQNETTDFSIRRNTLYEVTLDFTQNMVHEEEWRIEVGAPEVETLTFSKEEVDVVSGISDYILISGPRVVVNVGESDENDPEECAYDLSDVVIGGKEYQKLTFYTDKEITGFYPWNEDYRKTAVQRKVVVETAETYNGVPLSSRTVTAYVYNKAFPVFIRMGTNSSSAPYQLEALTNAPVHCEFGLSATVSADVESSGTASSYTYSSSTSSMGSTAEGFKACRARFSNFYNSLGTSSEKTVYFRKLDVTISGKKNEYCTATDFYMGDGGEAYWGPGASMAPQKLADLPSDESISVSFTHSCSVPGCIRYEIYSGSTYMFAMAPKGHTCRSSYTTGTSNCLSYDVSEYGTGQYIPFYIANGDLMYSAPVKLVNDSAKYLDDSARKSIIFNMSGPGRDVFYPNGVAWGDSADGAPGTVHEFGYTAGLTKQFFGNIHVWQIYQKYECDFYMTVNGCTSWPGASRLSSGFRLTYNL